MVKKITWLLVVRLILVTSFLSVGALVFKIDRSFFYFLIALVYFLSLIYLVWLLRRRALTLLVVSQLVIDCILVSIIVLYTGSIDSIFTTFYIISILTASVIISPLAGMITTGLVSVLYVGQLFLGINNLIPFITVKPWTKDFSSVIYTVHFHIVTFLLAGLLATILSRKIHQMEAKIKEKERTSLLGELAAHIAHEIRNPLTTISGSIELLEEELRPTLSEKLATVMRAIVTESERVSGIFTQFLDYSKLDKLTYSSFSLHTLLDEILLLLENNNLTRRIVISKEYTDGDISLEADNDRLRQVFWNIIRNALEAMPDGGTFRIGTHTEGEYVHISFIDSGTGIDEAQRRKLFVPFHSTKRHGSGLGLVIAQKIIEKHGGHIRVTSTPRKGASFVVILPRIRVGA